MYLICKEAKVKDQIKTIRNEDDHFDLKRKGLVINESTSLISMQ